MALRHSRSISLVFLALWYHLLVLGTFWGQQLGILLLVDSAVSDGRHSYGLTTFDPDGKLGQVERALVASSLGTPIVGVVKGTDIILASPQILPSPFMNDDGTPRFSVVSPQIVIGHSGISSDGRVIAESAQRLAIEHSYTYDEPIPIGLFLEEISLLFQAYTMKPGARPFGCTLLVGYLPPSGSKPRLFQIDCSGAVLELETVAIINGKFQDETKDRLSDFAKQQDCQNDETDREAISRILQQGLESTSIGSSSSTNDIKSTKKTKSRKEKSNDESEDTVRLPLRIISASFNREEGFTIERRMATSGSN